MAGNYAVSAIKGKGVAKAQNTLYKDRIKPDLMHKYHFTTGDYAANNHIEGYIYVNKAFNASNGIANGDILTITVIDGT